MSRSHLFIITASVLIVLFLLNIFLGAVDIPFTQVIAVLTGDSSNATCSYIILNSRLPQALTALFCGSALATAGLLLQTVFKNPLAGPDILGVNSGASLGVAVVMLFFSGTVSAGTIVLSGFIAVLIAAFIGAVLVMALILLFSRFVKSNVMLLIIGIMVGYLASSAISLLNYFSTDEGVQSYIVWGMGNFSGVSIGQMPVFASLILIGIICAILLIKPLNLLLLGESYAENLGVRILRTRNLLLVVTGLLSAVTTAFCGPIAFIGLAVPHIARLLLRSDNHRTLLPMTILCGGGVALVCNLICSLPGEYGLIPLSAVTPFIGAPIIIYIILKSR
ncbi:MAG: iron ABC transporter permease [Prevotellaceae bacterium]|nr:iron ABC transporter permease [Prevotellaceae bacterium]